jgi:peptide/nickel transport system substrate-binding protein
MRLSIRGFSVITAFLAVLSIAATASGQKIGGILKLYSPISPGNLSLLEEPTIGAQMPMMGVFNNLIMFDQHKKQVSLGSIVPDLATSWSWSEDATELTFQLRHDVKWHDGKPFTAADVKCSWELRLGTAPEKLRLNFQKSAFYNLTDVTTNGDFEVTFHLKRPQAAFPMLIAGGFAVVTPCHLSPAELRQHPIGTGPFKFVGFKPDEYIKVTRNPDYWNPNRPYLDGVEYTIIRDPSTAVLAFISGKFDMTFPYDLTVPLMNDVQSQMPQAICEMTTTGVNRHLLVNYHSPPFDNRDMRRAMSLSLDRKSFIDILAQGQGEIGGVLQPPPEGLWGLTADQLQQLPGHGPDVHKNRTEGRQIMQKLGYGPDHRLSIKVTTRDLHVYRDPAVLLIDQLKHVYIDGELELVDTAQYFPKLLRKDYTVALNLQTSGPDPDPILQVFYGCGASINWDGYCTPEVDTLIERQSLEGDQEKRKPLLSAIEKKLAEDDARPIIFYAKGGTCLQPWVKGLTIIVNGIFYGWRMEDVWLDK